MAPDRPFPIGARVWAGDKPAIVRSWSKRPVVSGSPITYSVVVVGDPEGDVHRAIDAGFVTAREQRMPRERDLPIDETGLDTNPAAEDLREVLTKNAEAIPGAVRIHNELPGGSA